MSDSWQRRWNPVFAEWCILSAQTGQRPWQGKTDAVSEPRAPFDPSCYLCPGVVRARGQQNPTADAPWAFDNDFASFAEDAPVPQQSADPCVRTASTLGRCRVLVWSSQHHLSLAQLPMAQMREVVALWQREWRALSVLPEVQYWMLFENKGPEVGASNPHPHGQIYATGYVPARVSIMRGALRDWRQQQASGLWDQLLAHPAWRDLIVDENAHFVHWVPWAARFPYESWIVSKQPWAHLAAMPEVALDSLAEIYQHACIRYDNLFQRDFPNISLHYSAPCDGVEDRDWRYFVCFQPPLRDAERLKFLAGFESGGGDVVNPLDPSVAAASLRAQSQTHFRQH